MREKKRAEGTLSPVILTSSCLSCVAMAHCFLMFNQKNYCVFVYLLSFYRKYCLNLNTLSREFGNASPNVFFPKKNVFRILQLSPKVPDRRQPKISAHNCKKASEGRTVKLTASRPIKTYLLLYIALIKPNVAVLTIYS